MLTYNYLIKTPIKDWKKQYMLAFVYYQTKHNEICISRIFAHE